MTLALAFAFLVVSAGWAVLRFFREPPSLSTIGLAPAAGLTLLVVPASWAALLHVPLPPVGALSIALGVTGVVDLVRWARMQKVQRNGSGGISLLALSLGCVIVIQAVAFGQVLAPLSPQDGAFHTQIIDILRSGAPWQPSWYPPGLHAAFAVLLQMVPWVDSALGSFWLGMGLSLLLPLAVFVWAAASGATSASRPGEPC